MYRGAVLWRVSSGNSIGNSGRQSPSFLSSGRALSDPGEEKTAMGDCLFCGIANREIKGSIVYENETVVAVKDVNLRAPVHILIIPRKHVATLLDLGDEDKGIMAEIFFAANRLAESHGIAGNGFRVLVN